MSQPIDWRIALQEWQENNPKKMPEELANLHREFLRRFPRDHIRDMTLEEYALGHDDSKDSFCYWLEWQTGKLGSVRGGSSAKWGVWWKSDENDWVFNRAYPYDDPNDALRHIKNGLATLIEAVENNQFDQLDKIGDKQLGQNRNSLRAKPLYLYFPEQFLPISNPVHLANILQYFDQKPKKGLHTRNRQLLAYLRSMAESGLFSSEIIVFEIPYAMLVNLQ